MSLYETNADLAAAEQKIVQLETLLEKADVKIGEQEEEIATLSTENDELQQQLSDMQEAIHKLYINYGS